MRCKGATSQKGNFSFFGEAMLFCVRMFQRGSPIFATMDATQIALAEAKAGLPKIADKEKESDVGVILSVSGPGA